MTLLMPVARKFGVLVDFESSARHASSPTTKGRDCGSSTWEFPQYDAWGKPEDDSIDLFDMEVFKY